MTSGELPPSPRLRFRRQRILVDLAWVASDNEDDDDWQSAIVEGLGPDAIWYDTHLLEEATYEQTTGGDPNLPAPGG